MEVTGHPKCGLSWGVPGPTRLSAQMHQKDPSTPQGFCSFVTYLQQSKWLAQAPGVMGFTPLLWV